jgi:gamma-glutamyltranspeptidase / glutathione hydrolase
VRYTLAPARLQSISAIPARGYEAKRRRARTCAALTGRLCVALLLGGVSTTRAATPPPLLAPHAAVASDHAAASAAGVQVLRAGGNAADAACAAALALGVVNPHASGIGGGGFAVIYRARDKSVHTLDFREQAPLSIRPDMFLEAGKPVPARARRGGLAVGVPGEVRGLAELIKRFGKRSFAECVRPAEQLAVKGFAVTPRLALAVEKNGSATNTTTDLAAIRAVLAGTLQYKAPLRPGDRVTRPALARTLRQLRQRGPETFYAGPIALAIVKAVKEAGGVMLPEDLRRYTVIERKPIEIGYRGLRVIAMPPPSSGGVVLAEVLGVLSAWRQQHKQERLPERQSSAYFHVVAEALKHGFADRARFLGDPDFVQVPTGQLLDPAYHRQLAARIDDRKVLANDKYGMGPGPAPPSDGGTAHLSVIDAEGNAVALTTTVNLWFGAHLLAGDTGIVLNNQMDDFALAPDTPNEFQLLGNAQNAVAPGKRPLSSMSPTLVLDGDAVKMVVGGAGGPSIITGTLQVMLNVLEHQQDAQAASAAPRIHHQWSPAELGYEIDVPRDVVEALQRRGHKTKARDPSTPALINVIVRTPAGLQAAAEFRSGGAPAGY